MNGAQYISCSFFQGQAFTRLCVCDLLKRKRSLPSPLIYKLIRDDLSTTIMKQVGTQRQREIYLSSDRIFLLITLLFVRTIQHLGTVDGDIQYQAASFAPSLTNSCPQFLKLHRLLLCVFLTHQCLSPYFYIFSSSENGDAHPFIAQPTFQPHLVALQGRQMNFVRSASSLFRQSLSMSDSIRILIHWGWGRNMLTCLMTSSMSWFCFSVLRAFMIRTITASMMFLRSSESWLGPL
ncbi:hypothetical protein FGO68_gene15443 [Halteria grandinella]|uniref:Uncharacterized protein n=1 Tax=Halteria grandinella TaxID=5974 RepID=A0A8J8SW38_HALGN|nr:hypothetical protein FGO68_gene15443 [Halteria grandinella]